MKLRKSRDEADVLAAFLTMKSVSLYYERPTTCLLYKWPVQHPTYRENRNNRLLPSANFVKRDRLALPILRISSAFFQQLFCFDLIYSNPHPAREKPAAALFISRSCCKRENLRSKNCFFTYIFAFHRGDRSLSSNVGTSGFAFVFTTQLINPDIYYYRHHHYYYYYYYDSRRHIQTRALPYAIA